MTTILDDVETHDRLLDRIYDASLRPDRWASALGEICEAFDASKGVIFTFRHGPAEGGFAITHNLSQAQMEAWSQISPKEDPYVRAIPMKDWADGAVFEGGAMVTRESLHATRMYQDIWKVIGIEHPMFGVIFDGVDGHKLPTSISLFRGPESAPFGPAEIAALRRLVRHLSRSMGVMFHLRDADNRLAASQAALDRLNAGVAMIDASGAVRHANAAATELFRQGDCFMLRDERLVLGSSVRGMQQRFDAAIAGALAPLSQEPEHFSNGLTITDSAGKPVCVMHAAPVGTLPGDGAEADDVRAIVFFYSLADAPTLDQGVLRQTFGLTPAESRAANAVLEGGSVREAAGRLGISENTLKTQLRAVYLKTSTRRQADLLKLLLALSSG